MFLFLPQKPSISSRIKFKFSTAFHCQSTWYKHGKEEVKENGLWNQVFWKSNSSFTMHWPGCRKDERSLGTFQLLKFLIYFLIEI